MRFASSPATFVVEEIPAYAPSGEGTHTFVWIEKAGLGTPDAVRQFAQVLAVRPQDIGYAGLKDRHATTRQWLSLPGVDPERALTCEMPGLRVLEARRHGNKLRTGHLHGNRFEAVLEDATDADAERVATTLADLGRQGVPNRYGAQRFGAQGDNAARGLAILRGQEREPDRRRRGLLLSAAQSDIFNRVLDARAAGPGLRRVLVGDVLMKAASGGLFVCDDPARDQARLDAGELWTTGPMPGARSGARIPEPPIGSEARALEDAALAAAGATAEDFTRAGRQLPGTRRPLFVPVKLGEPALVREEEGRLRVRFELPPGSYGTIVVGVLIS